MTSASAGVFFSIRQRGRRRRRRPRRCSTGSGCRRRRRHRQLSHDAFDGLCFFLAREVLRRRHVGALHGVCARVLGLGEHRVGVGADLGVVDGGLEPIDASRDALAAALSTRERPVVVAPTGSGSPLWLDAWGHGPGGGFGALLLKSDARLDY
jgi:hypothetical protein